MVRKPAIAMRELWMVDSAGLAKETNDRSHSQMHRIGASDGADR